MFADKRFGCLSRAAAVLVYNFDHLVEFLNQNPPHQQPLDLLGSRSNGAPLPYRVILVVFACLGVHLVEPFYTRTIEKGATHTNLRDFYKGLHISLSQPISDQYTRFTQNQSSVELQRTCSRVLKKKPQARGR